jgi:hypothetical protein
MVIVLFILTAAFTSKPASKRSTSTSLNLAPSIRVDEPMLSIVATRRKLHLITHPFTSNLLQASLSAASIHYFKIY